VRDLGVGEAEILRMNLIGSRPGRPVSQTTVIDRSDPVRIRRVARGQSSRRLEDFSEFYRAFSQHQRPFPQPREDRCEVRGGECPRAEQLTPERIAADGAAYLDYLQDAGATEPVAITGYCMGGRVGWWITKAHPERVAALAGFHVGGLVNDDPNSPHLSAPDVDAETYWGFADEDPSMTAEQITAFEQTLDEAGTNYRIEVYEGAKHGYTMVDSPVYDEAAAERHFQELRALLERTLENRGSGSGTG